jgi:hypothetical protein
MKAHEFFDVWPMLVRVAAGVRRDGGSVATLMHGEDRLRETVRTLHGNAVANETARWLVLYVRGEP